MGRAKKQKDLFGDSIAEEVEAPVEETAPAPVEKKEPEKKEKKATKMQLNPCSWCGGYRKTVECSEPDIRIGFEVSERRAPSNQWRRLVACELCVFKMFNNACGQVMFYGQEIEHLTRDLGDKTPTQAGFLPDRNNKVQNF